MAELSHRSPSSSSHGDGGTHAKDAVAEDLLPAFAAYHARAFTSRHSGSGSGMCPTPSRRR